MRRYNEAMEQVRFIPQRSDEPEVGRCRLTLSNPH